MCIRDRANDDAMAAYNAKNNEVAGAKFLEVNNLLGAAGSDEKLYKYYAAIAYNQAKKYDIASNLYSELINEGSTCLLYTSRCV